MITPFIELFCGIGGFAHALHDRATVAAAIDINQNALEVYRQNYRHAASCKAIESLTPQSTEEWANKSWWMSPPCQPFTRRGKQLDIADTRSQAFLNVLKLFESHRPPELAMENVPEFENSESHQRLTQLLGRLGYHFRQRVMCQTEFGTRNRRRRYYLIAAKEKCPHWKTIESNQHPSAQPGTTNANTDETLILRTKTIDEYQKAIDVVSIDSKTSCFTSAYGRSIVRSGSFLKTEKGVRRFSPREVLQQLGFTDDFVLPDWPNEKLWPLVGNSLSIPSVKYVISHLPSFHIQNA